MPKADTEHTSSRRNFLGRMAGGAAVAAVATTAASTGALSVPVLAGHNPDAELIALCEEFNALNQEHIDACDLIDGSSEHEWAADEIGDELKELGDYIGTFKPSTPAGYAALVKSILADAPEILEDHNYFNAQKFLAALFRGLTAGGVA